MQASQISNKLPQASSSQPLENRVMLMGVSAGSSLEDLSKQIADGDPINFEPGDYSSNESTELLRTAFTNASNITFNPGDYNIGQTVDVRLDNNDLNITANGANFKGPKDTATLFGFKPSFEGKRSENAYYQLGNENLTEEEKAELRNDFTWTGGTFDLTESARVLDNQLRSVIDNRDFNVDSNKLWTFKATGELVGGDGAKPSDNDLRTKEEFQFLRDKYGFGERLGGAGIGLTGRARTLDNFHGFGNVKITGVTMNAGGGGPQNNAWLDGNGDSGVFVTEAKNIEVSDSNFSGFRDAAVYLTDRDGVGTENTVVKNNLIEDSYAGLAFKRGIDNVTVEGNVSLNTFNGITFEPAGTGGESRGNPEKVANFRSTNVDVRDNFLTSLTARPIKLLNSTGSFRDNTIYSASNGTKTQDTNAVSRAFRQENVEDTDGNSISKDDLEKANTIVLEKKGDIDSLDDTIIASLLSDLESRRAAVTA